MSKLPHEGLTMSAWSPEVSVVARRPSWMARRLSTRPPAPTVVPSVPPTPQTEPPLPDLAASIQEAVSIAPEVDLSASNVIAQLADDNAALREQVAEMAGAMARLRRQVLEASEGELVKLALAIAERVVARELSVSPDLIALWAREAIDALAAKDEVVIAVAKDVAGDVGPDAWAAIGLGHQAHQVLADSQLAPGAIEVRTPQGIVAVGAEARLTAVATALGVIPS
jgi:flagellar assembly protein FliH